MTIIAVTNPLAQVAPRADEHSKTKEPLPPRPRGPHPYRVVGGASRPEDSGVRGLLAGWFGEYAPMVRGVVARKVVSGDLDLVEDLAQDVWLEAWRYLLRGQTAARPAGLLAFMARCRVRAHYRSARVRREQVTDFQDDSAAVARLALWIVGAADREAQDGGLDGVELEGALAEQRHQLDDPALEVAFAGLAPRVGEGRWAA